LISATLSTGRLLRLIPHQLLFAPVDYGLEFAQYTRDLTFLAYPQQSSSPYRECVVDVGPTATGLSGFCWRPTVAGLLYSPALPSPGTLPFRALLVDTYLRIPCLSRILRQRRRNPSESWKTCATRGPYRCARLVPLS